MIRTLTTTVAGILVLGAALVALAAAAAAQTGAPAAEDPDGALATRALESLAGGDAAAAVEILEPVRERPDPPQQLLALLGTAYLEAGRPEEALQILGPLADTEDADPAVLYNAGRAARAAGEPERAAGYLERSVALQAGTPAARELGLIRGAEHRPREAYRLLRPWVLRNPGDVEARLAAALAAIRLDRVPEAEELLDQMPADEPRVRLLWGRIRLLQDDPRGALATLAPILEEVSGALEDDVRTIMAEARLALGESAEAVDLLRGRTEDNPAAALLLAQAQVENGDVDGALEALRPFAERLLTIAPPPGGPIDRMERRPLAFRTADTYGRALAAAGRHEEALPHLRLAARLAPETAPVWQSLAETLEALGRTDDAAEARVRFQSLSAEDGSTAGRSAADVTEDPTDRALRRAQALLAEGRTDDAIEVLADESELAPEDVRPRLLVARTLLLAERPDDAMGIAEETVRRFPEHPDAYYQRGAVHLAREDLEAAERDLRRALELAPDHVPAMNDLAVLLLVDGRRGEAERLLERVLELRPDDPRARQNLERLRSAPQGG